ncbi:MAG: phage integrase SAM-like domain-containing protein [Lentilitoribacter sp.]
MGTTMGTTLGTTFHPPSLIQIPSKGNKWFVVLTKPDELRTFSKGKQVRRSTGTSDKKLAETRSVQIANEIYEEFQKEIDEIHLKAKARLYDPAARLTTQISVDPNTCITTDAFSIKHFGLDKDPKLKFSRLIPQYIEHLEMLNRESRKERNTKLSKLNEFLKVVDEKQGLQIEDVKKVHAYDYAEWMALQGRANKTIRSNVSRISAMLGWAERKGFIELNPFVQLDLKEYGSASKSWLPFSWQELVDIFAQEMLKDDRIALTLLATTGARLDEIALLEWSQIKHDMGITYIDLSEALVKNAPSRRAIPVHSKVVDLLKEGGEGRIFKYTLDKDGKAQNDAGKQLAKYVDNITSHPQKVLHSFRGTFKDLLRNAGLTKTMMDKLESGEVTLGEVSVRLDEQSVSKELNDRITGHAQSDVAGKYGIGHHLVRRAAAIEKIDVSFLPNG